MDLLEDERISDIKYNLLNEPAVLFEVCGKSVGKKIEDVKEDCPGVFVSTADTIIEYFFKEQRSSQKITGNENKSSVLCLIKPHIIHANQTGDLMKSLSNEGFSVTNIKLCHLDRAQSDEFLRVYEGVVPEFIQISIHLASGALLALQLTCDRESEEVHSRFRNFCGPSDSVSGKMQNYLTHLMQSRPVLGYGQEDSPTHPASAVWTEQNLQRRALH